MLILGRKKFMTSIYIGDKRVPVTAVELDKVVVANKFPQDNQNILVIGVGQKKKPSKALLGVYKDLGYVPQTVKQVKVSKDVFDKYKIGDSLDDLLSADLSVAIAGISKGKGFAGVMKRWNFAGGKRTHGQSDRERAPGSIGAGTTPGRVVKGKKMGGHMGVERITVKNLKVVALKEIDKIKYALITGSVPGAPNSIIEIKFDLKAGES